MFDLYLITPEREPRALLETARAVLPACPPGRVGLQLRSKTLPGPERAALARALCELAQAHGVALLINTDLELARALGADGVQLPEHGPSPAAARAQLGAGALIGASRHDREGVHAAERSGASFVTLGPVFAVPDKAAPLGLAAFTAIARDCRIPVFGLGGIDATRAAAVVAAGAHGVALIRELWDNPQPARTVAALLAAIDSARGATR